MSGTATEFTAAATARLDDYLRQVRAAVATAPDLDADDIEADIREHVAAEFQAHTRAVSLVELERVLVALGPPTGWAPIPAGRPTAGFSPLGLLSGVKRRLLGVVGTLWRGPEDWRLAYLCLILTVLAIPTMGLSLVLAYLLGRAAVALAADKGEPLGARRWLVYPAVGLVALPLLLAATLWPVAVAPITFNTVIDPAERYREWVDTVQPDGTVTLRRDPGPAIKDRAGRVVRHEYQYGLDHIGVRWHPAPGVWHINPDDRQLHELTLRALDRMPVPLAARGVFLCLFAGLGAVLLWGLVVGLVGWQFPRTVAAVFFPLLSGDGSGAAKLAVGCGAGFVVWVGFACRLVDVGGRWA